MKKQKTEIIIEKGFADQKDRQFYDLVKEKFTLVILPNLFLPQVSQSEAQKLIETEDEYLTLLNPAFMEMEYFFGLGTLWFDQVTGNWNLLLHKKSLEEILKAFVLIFSWSENDVYAFQFKVAGEDVVRWYGFRDGKIETEKEFSAEGFTEMFFSNYPYEILYKVPECKTDVQ